MKRAFIFGLLLLATPALAQTLSLSLNASGFTYLFVAQNTDGSPILELSPGGCLKGELKIFSKDGKVVFSQNAASSIGDCNGAK